MSDQEKLSPEVEKEIKARARKIVLGLVGVTAELRAQRLAGRKDMGPASKGTMRRKSLLKR